MDRKDLSTRRSFLVSTGTLAAGIGMPDLLLAQELPPTPACRDGSEPTARQTEGPFFRPSSPERADLREAGASGRLLELTGVVLTRACRPVPRALVDLWHADDKGEYDNRGFRYRGHQWTDAQGRFRFRTIVPAVYPGRTRHFHVKVQGGGSRVLTTQLYFPGDPGNQRDGLFRRDLLMRTTQAGNGLNAQFDFVIDVR